MEIQQSPEITELHEETEIQYKLSSFMHTPRKTCVLWIFSHTTCMEKQLVHFEKNMFVKCLRTPGTTVKIVASIKN